MVVVGLISVALTLLMIVLVWPLALIAIAVGHSVARYKGKTVSELLEDKDDERK